MAVKISEEFVQEMVDSLMRCVEGEYLENRVYTWKGPKTSIDHRDFDVKVEFAPTLMDFKKKNSKDDGADIYGFFTLNISGLMRLLKGTALPGEFEVFKGCGLNTGPSGIDTGPHFSACGVYRGIRVDIVFFFQPFPDAKTGVVLDGDDNTYREKD